MLTQRIRTKNAWIRQQTSSSEVANRSEKNRSGGKEDSTMMRKTALLFLLAASTILHQGCEAFSGTATPVSHGRSTVVATQQQNGSPKKPGCHHATRTNKQTTGLAMRGGGGNNEIEGLRDRVLSCVPYLVPLIDGDRYGRYIFSLVPALGFADAVLLGPFKVVYSLVPFGLGQLAAFVALSSLARNPEISRPVRFNMQQALVLDIALVFPSLFGQLGFVGALPGVVTNSCSNFVFYFLVGTVGYALFSNLTGKLPNQIPIFSEAAETSIGPF